MHQPGQDALKTANRRQMTRRAAEGLADDYLRLSAPEMDIASSRRVSLP